MRILVINPGSTSTKVALFRNGSCALNAETVHSKEDLLALGPVLNQMDLRREAVVQALSQAGETGSGLDAVVGRGGLLAPMPGGTYAITEAMAEDLTASRHGEHPSNLGALLAREFAASAGCPAFIVDPPVTDEMMDVSRVTGLPETPRRSVFHALSQRGAARKVARDMGLDYAQGAFIVAHLGGGISIGAHLRGRVVDVINALDGEGPFSPERSGRLPVLRVLDLLEREGLDPAALKARLLTRSGLYAHLGTNDLREAEARMAAGDSRAALVFRALAYNIAREISSLLPVFATGSGGMILDAVALTGGMARSPRLVEAIRANLAFPAPVLAVTGLEEMEVLAEGAAMALRGETEIRIYQG